jgi:hypothetical protein
MPVPLKTKQNPKKQRKKKEREKKPCLSGFGYL